MDAKDPENDEEAELLFEVNKGAFEDEIKQEHSLFGELSSYIKI